MKFNKEKFLGKYIMRGTALVYVLTVVAAASVLFAGTIQFVVSHVKYNTSLEPDTQAIHVSEAGIYFYRWYLAHNVEGKTATQIEEFWTNNPLGVDDNGDGDCDDADTADGDGDGTEAYIVDYEDENHNKIGQYKLCVTAPTEYSTVLNVKSQGSASSSGINQERTISARLRKPSWSEFAILANNRIRLSSGTEVYGPMHINGGFHFDGIAHNIVTSSVSSYYDNDSDVRGWRSGVWAAAFPGFDNSEDVDDSEHFLAGKEFPVVAQDFNSVTANFDLMREAAQAMGLYYGPEERGRFIELGVPTSNQMRITRVRKFNNNTLSITRLRNSDVDIVDIPDVGILYVRDNVWIEGVLPAGKKLTVAAHSPDNGHEARIFLGADDIVYEDRNSDSVLGLAAEGNIEFIRNSEGDLNASSGSDTETLTIDAALLSQNGRVGRKYWSNNYKDTIELYGSIATNNRMGFGYTDGTGFETRNLIFDGNLLYQPPPLFPTGNSYAIDMWNSAD
ncbi:MAG: hypothetical protein ACKUBY_04975 [Candidatus Moraniibacteriota bacterium]|jgi:hypothetical protein